MALFKRNIFVVNPNFQYKFSFIVCMLVLLSSLLYPATIWQLFEKIISLQPDRAMESASHRDQLMLILLVIQLSFIGIVFVGLIFLSHKVAGPMYKLKNHIEGIIDGDTPSNIFFRKGDYFPEMAETINNLMDNMESRQKEDFEYLSEVISYINNLSLVVPEDKKPVINEINSKLLEIQTRYQS